MRIKVARVKARRIRRAAEMDTRGKGIGFLAGDNIGHLEQPMSGCDMRHARQGAIRCPIRFEPLVIREMNKYRDHFDPGFPQHMWNSVASTLRKQGLGVNTIWTGDTSDDLVDRDF